MTGASGPSCAALGPRRFPDASACMHCAAPVRETGYQYGQPFEHYDPDAAFRDSVWTHCRLSVATPPASGSEDAP